jgi:E3 ubiquitin-protein ligase TRIP12
VIHVLRLALRDGIRLQTEAFRRGFSLTLPFSRLRCFTVAELEAMLSGQDEEWDSATVLEQIKADHGYTIDSPAVTMLAEIMSEMSGAEQRLFLRFISGAPRLPIGGLEALKPKLTVVRKSPDSGKSADEYLPSASTCTNYLKLPSYSSKQVMKQRLFYSMNEGQGSFHLS